MRNLLVIGYGNELRGDDGVGPRIARSVAALARPGVRAVAAHQLTPEMAELVLGADAVVFVDARVDAVAVEVLAVAEGQVSAGWGHTSNPRWLMSLTCAVYGHAPPAWLVTIPAIDLGMGDRLSDEATQGMAEALRRVLALVDSLKEAACA
jgi:hydrogenase maturation protease